MEPLTPGRRTALAGLARLSILGLLVSAAPLAAHEKTAGAGVMALDVYAQNDRIDLLTAVDRGERGVELRHRRSADGGTTWSDGRPVDLGGVAVARPHRGSDPQIAAFGDRLVVLWTAPGTSPWGSGPLASSWSADGGLTWHPGPNPADDGSTDGHGYADLVADAAGRFHAVWLDGRGGRQGLRAARSADGGRTWSANRTVDGDTCTCCWNRMIATGSGEVLVIYRDAEPRDLAVAATADGGDTWRRLAAADRSDWRFDGCPHVGGALASAGDPAAGAPARYHALLWTGADGRQGLYAAVSDDRGRSWSEARPVAGGRGHRGDLAVQGNVLAAAWDLPSADGRQVFAATSPDGGLTWGDAQQLSDDGADASQPLVVAAGDRFLAFWTESRGSEPGTWKSAGFGVAATTPGASATVRVRGLAEDPVGGPIAGATITATRLEGGHASTTSTDAGGRFVLELPAGAYRFEAAAELFETATREVEVGDGESLTFKLALPPFYGSVHVIERSRGELLRVPGGVAEIRGADLERVQYGNVQEALAFQPGVLARSRFGADGVQFSVRGSGLRNNFHMRGINLLFNGRPYMDADGFGDFESLDLAATEKIELWKGANALRFGGNQAGGAINFVTPTGRTAPAWTLRASGGSFGLAKGQVAAAGTRGPFSYYASLGTTDVDGYRDYSAQERRRLFSNFDWQLRSDTDLRFDLIFADVAEELPGSLTRAELDSDPRQANANNLANRYGRNYDFLHAAIALDRRIDDRSMLAVSVHGHVRDVIHPIFQILDQYQRTYGADVAYRRSGDRVRWLVGVSPQGGGNDEVRFANLGGAPGRLTAEFETDVRNLGLYGEVQIDLHPRLTWVAGGRWDASRREFVDLFLADGDRSDVRTFDAFSPKVGMVWASRSGVQVFANVSRSYEPPLLLELTSFGDNAGFIDLDAQDTWQLEVGTRGTRGALSWDVSLFDWEVDDEIININVQPFPFAPFTIPSYRNTAETRHFGLEAGTTVRFGKLTWRSAYTWSDFTYRDDPEFGDNDLPGAPEHALYSELRYRHDSGFWIAPNLDASLSSYYVDSANTVENDRFAVLGLKAGFPVGRLDVVLDASNLTDEVYSGSVQVDSAIGRFFEPANGRSFFVGLTWRRDSR